MGAAAQMLGLTIFYACVFTILLNLVSLAIGWYLPGNRTPMYLGIGSCIVLALTGVMLVLNSPWDVFLLLVPSVALTIANLALWRRRSRDFIPHPSGNVDSFRILGGLFVALKVMLMTMVASCVAIYPLNYALGYLHHGRGPARINRNDIVKGSTTYEIRSKYGSPHQASERDGRQSWIYYGPGLAPEILEIKFDETNRVVETWILD